MAALTAVLATLILSRVLDVQSMQWQVVVATVALAAGIPHGALDHLVARPVGDGSTMSGFVARYVLTAMQEARCRSRRGSALLQEAQ